MVTTTSPELENVRCSLEHLLLIQRTQRMPSAVLNPAVRVRLLIYSSGYTERKVVHYRFLWMGKKTQKPLYFTCLLSIPTVLGHNQDTACPFGLCSMHLFNEVS